MYFTSTPSLNSMEAIMQRPPGRNQRGGGRLRRVYPVSKADCDCRLCLYYRKKKGCSMEGCPVLDVRLSCGAASFYEAVHAAFTDACHIPFQRRLSHLYDRKDDAPMIFQTDQHRQRFETQKLHLRKPDHRSLAVLYLLTADHVFWSKTRRYFSDRGKVDLQAVRLGDVSTDCYAIWKAVKELQTGQRQISLCELADGSVISDRAFCLIVQAVAIARFGAVVLEAEGNNTESADLKMKGAMTNERSTA